MVDKVYLGVIVVLVVIVAYLVVQTNQSSAEQFNQANAGSTVKALYELQYESPAEVLGVSEINGVYKVSVRFTDFTGQPTTQDVFVTKDGKLMTDRFIVTENYRNALSSQKTFIECLRDSGVRILGQSNDTATLQQISLLGTYSYKLFVSCDGANQETCTGLGVTRYPTTVYNNSGFPNIYSVEFYTQLTNCSVV